MSDATTAPKADILESEEWQKAVDYSITDEDIERQRALLGFDLGLLPPGSARRYDLQLQR